MYFLCLVVKTNSFLTKVWVQLLAGSALLASFALINKFPLIYPDTGAYIESGFSNVVPLSRPIFYGWFLRHSSLATSLWLPIFFQAWILSFTLFHFLSLFLRNPKLLFIPLVAILVLTSNVSHFTSVLIPDIFSGIGVLALFICAEQKQPILRVSFASIAVLSCLFHFSNLLVFTFLFICLLAYSVKRKKEILLRTSNALMKVLFITILCSFFIMVSTNKLLTEKFSGNTATHVYLMNHFIENGLFHSYLSKNCATNTRIHTFCEHADRYGINFIWNPKSPLYDRPEWNDWKEDHEYVLKEILFSIDFIPINALKTVEYGFVQAFSFDTYKFSKQDENSSPFHSIKYRFKESITEFFLSNQGRDKQDYAALNALYYVVLVLSLIVGWISFHTHKLSHKLVRFILLFAAYYLLNALICANFSTIDSRYSARIIWIVPLMTWIMIGSQIEKRSKTASISN